MDRRQKKIIKTNSSFLICSSLERGWLPLLMEEIEKMEFVLRPPIKMYNKIHQQPRDVAFYSDEVSEYKYSGYAAKASKLSDLLKKLLNFVNVNFGACYNGILVNRYNDGNDSISMHSDKIGECDATAGVVSMSFGASRTFVVKRKVQDPSSKNEWKIPMDHGMILHMGGKFQEEFTHGVLKETISPSAVFGTRRVNFTFRVHQNVQKYGSKIIKSIKK